MSSTSPPNDSHATLVTYEGPEVFTPASKKAVLITSLDRSAAAVSFE